MVLMELDYSTIVRSFDNPVKAKIIATLHNNGPLTPKGLLIHLKNMPQATLYRQIRAFGDRQHDALGCNITGEGKANGRFSFFVGRNTLCRVSSILMHGIVNCRTTILLFQGNRKFKGFLR